MIQYKDSGIEWIGKIPDTWETKRLKEILFERNNRNAKGKTLLSVSQYYGIKPKAETDIADSHIAESYEDYKVVEKGDFVMNIMLAWNGSYAVSEYDGMVSPAYCVYQFRTDCCHKYFHYLLRTSGYQTAFKTMSRGIIDSRLRLYPEQFYTFNTIFPPVQEQKRIANYLNEKCREVDFLIELQEKMIDKLKAYKQSIITEAVTKGLNPNVKLVPSGIHWIGNMPEGWKEVPLKSILQRRSEKNNPVKTKERLSLSIDKGVTLYAEKTTNLDRFKDDFTQYQLAYPNDIVLNSMNMIVGAVGLSNYYGCVSPVYYVVYSKYSDTDIRYYSYLLNTQRIRDVYHSLGQGIYAIERGEGRVNTCRLKVSYDDFGVIRIPVPSITEQRTISNYLDEKCADIDRLIALKLQKIESLKEYKKSVIFEVVTGKTIVN